MILPKAVVLATRRADVNFDRRERKMGRPNWKRRGRSMTKREEGGHHHDGGITFSPPRSSPLLRIHRPTHMVPTNPPIICYYYNNNNNNNNNHHHHYYCYYHATATTHRADLGIYGSYAQPQNDGIGHIKELRPYPHSLPG